MQVISLFLCTHLPWNTPQETRKKSPIFKLLKFNRLSVSTPATLTYIYFIKI